MKTNYAMKVRVDSRAEAEPRETLVRFFTTEERAGIPSPQSIPEAEWSGAPNSTLMLHHAGLLCVGLGDRAKVTEQTLRTAAGTAIRTLQKAGRLRAALDLRDYPKWTSAATAGALLGQYAFQEFKKKAPPVETVRLIVKDRDLPAARKAARHGEIAGASANLARQVGNQPGNLLYPETLAAECRRVATREKLKATIFNEKQLQQGGFGGLLAVGAGSTRPPRLIVLRHDGGRPSEAPIALVGKAITFDTGGISIKPAEKMEEMIFDKCGGMAVLGAMAGIARLKLKRNVVGIIASAENMPSAAAYRPGDIVKTYDGTYVEVINTDAEGRMVLADAIAYARRDCKAAAVIDLATLTGACVVALGEYAAGLWSTSESLRAALLTASDKTGERLWPMPLYEEYTDQIRSEVAALKNTGGRPGGACTAAAFLKAFAGDTAWAHLDIAPVASSGKASPYLSRGATGFGTRLLIELVEQWRGPD
jgi:leucyl aminopeptidase